VGAAVDRLVEVIAALREHCLWTAALTHEGLVEYLVEESYELLETIERHRPDDELRGELADVLLQVVLHARIASERGAFDLEGIARTLTEKMIRRNTHVFAPDGTLRESFPDSIEEIVRSWDAAKRAERPERTDPFAGLPRHLPALVFADKALGRGERWLALENGPDTPDPAASLDSAASVGPAASLDGGAAPERDSGPVGRDGAAVANPAVFANEEELGEHLLGIVRAARAGGLDAERALRAAVVRHTETGWRALR
jgi:NTP pyrophosphatase (non-canonical NTP hydrolase)